MIHCTCMYNFGGLSFVQDLIHKSQFRCKSRLSEKERPASLHLFAQKEGGQTLAKTFPVKFQMRGTGNPYFFICLFKDDS